MLVYKPQHKSIPEYDSLPDNALKGIQEELYEKYASSILCMDSTQMSTNLMYVTTCIVSEEYGKVREYSITLYIAIGSMLATTS